MNEVQEWLKDVPIEKYIDIQATTQAICAQAIYSKQGSAYHMLTSPTRSALKLCYSFAKRAGIASSSFEAAKHSSLPPAPNANAWYGATLLRKYLRGGGWLNEAALLLEAESGMRLAIM